MHNTHMMDFNKHADEYGSLVPVEANKDIPFEIKRVYYIYGVDQNQRRGFHSHNDLHQALICINGSVKILVKNPNQEEIIELNDPSKALYIGPKVWREMYDFTEGSVLLVLASEYYTEDDYIRNYDDYLADAIDYYKNI